MGFGILFTGYFLFLNVTGFAFTDLIAALIIALAFHKLSSVDSNFKSALFFSFALMPIGLAELVVELIEMFDPLLASELLLVISILAILRHLLAAVITVYMLLGIKSLAREVGLPDLKRKCGIVTPVSMVTYLLLALCEVGGIGFIDLKYVMTAAFIVLLFSFILTIYTLTLVYSAYMHICMPDDNDYSAAKPSRFGFVNKYREHTAKRDAEYAEYKLGKLKRKGEKKKKK